jgi:hypothetical protein
MSERYLYREVMRPPLWLMLFLAFMLSSFVLAIWAALDIKATIVTAIVSTVIIIMVPILGAEKIVLTTQELRVGRAHIERKYLGRVEEIATSDFVLLRTRGADPAAYHALVFWVSRGVKVTIEDQRDATPYWLISSKRGAALKRALES